MIFVRLSGGLGNQMFQYATARSLAIRKGCELFLDINALSKPDNNGVKRNFALDDLNIQAKVASKEDLKKAGLNALTNTGLKGKASRFLMALRDSKKPFFERKLVVEPSYAYSPELYKVNPPCLLIGVWQSERYFKDHEEIIRKEFIPKKPFSDPAQKIKSLIETTESVSVHIRRGDYASNIATAKKHGLCSPEYYTAAIEQISSTIKNPSFFVFSDDIEWVKANVTIPNAMFVSSENIPAHEELFLMSLCKHNIIANSSFSWWAAWLNKNARKIIICPKRWFALDTIKDADVVPKEWMRI